MGYIDYKRKTDEEILFLARGRDEIAVKEFIRRYKYLAYSCIQHYFLLGAETDDMIQEASIGILKAINTYNPDRGTLKSFVGRCVWAEVLTAVKSHSRIKHKLLSLSTALQDINDKHLPTIPDEPYEYSEMMGTMEGIENFAENDLTEIEQGALVNHLLGDNYEESAKRLGCSTKAVDNALTRTRKKLKNKMAEDVLRDNESFDMVEKM